MTPSRRSALFAALAVVSLPALTLAQGATRRARPSREEMIRAMHASKARADSAASRVTRLLVAPRSLELSVGDSVFSRDLYRTLDVRGLTAEGDTLRDIAKTFMLVPSELLARRGEDLFARQPGEATLWVLLGSDLKVDLRDTMRAVRVPIHIH